MLDWITTRIVLVLSSLDSEEKQLNLLQDLTLFILKLQREIKVEGKL